MLLVLTVFGYIRKRGCFFHERIYRDINSDKQPPDLISNSFPEIKDLCPVKTFEYYLKNMNLGEKKEIALNFCLVL